MPKTKIKHLRAESHASIGDVIERSTVTLIERWASRAREEQPTAARVHHDVLLDHMRSLLAQLGRSLSSASDDSAAVRRKAIEHGDQRRDTGWSVTEVVRDYQILRIVLFEFLEEALGRRLESRESLVLNVTVDDAIAASVAAYVASQTLPGTATNTTPSAALELLLNVLGTVAHELRNPLAPLAHSLEILRMAGVDATQIETSRQTMERQLRVLGRLVDDLMDLPRLARGKMLLRRERVDLAHIVRACAEDRRPSLEAAGLALVVETPNQPVCVLGDDTRLTQAVGNLIGNAQKFTDSGGSVTVRLATHSTTGAERAVLTVNDTGVGIEPGVLPKVFEAYVQADRSLDRSRGGLGLGLALVKGVVELHGGTALAASDGVGKGATFTISLPVSSSGDGELLGTPPAQPDARKTRHVLIIEDNTDSADSLRMYLELQGHAVQVAYSGPTGIATAAASALDVVICDVGLPGMDGYAVAAELRGLPVPPRLIIAVTGYGPRMGPAGEPDRVFDRYLLKPVELDQLMRLLAADASDGEAG